MRLGVWVGQGWAGVRSGLGHGKGVFTSGAGQGKGGDRGVPG